MNMVADIGSLEKEERAFASARSWAGLGEKAPSRARVVWGNRLPRFLLISLLIHGVVLLAAFIFFVGSPGSGSGQSFVVVEISGLSGGGTGKAVGAGSSFARQGKDTRFVKKTGASSVAASKIKAPAVAKAQLTKKAPAPAREASLRKVTMALAIPIKPAPQVKNVKEAQDKTIALDKSAFTSQMPSFAAEPTLTPVNKGANYFSVAPNPLMRGDASIVGRADVSDVSFALPSADYGATGDSGSGGVKQQGNGTGGAGRGASIQGFKAPSYPSLSRLKGEEGTVELRVKVGADGRHKEISLQRSSGFARLDRAAIKAIKRARFIPATSHGRPVPSTKTVAFVFKLKD